MAYVTSNPPNLAVQAIAGVRIWHYVSADAAATVDGSGYITNGGNLGMKVNDLVFVFDTVNDIVTTHQVITVSATTPGAVDLGNLTTVGLATNAD